MSQCQHPQTIVIETRTLEGKIYRKRGCKDCGHHHITVETIIAGPLPRAQRKSTAKPPEQRAAEKRAGKIGAVSNDAFSAWG